MKQRIYTLLFIFLFSNAVLCAKDDKHQRETAVFHVEIFCDGCVKNIQNNIAFEKGLKDMKINRKEQTVTLTWDPAKTDTTRLKTAFEKIHKPVSRIEQIERK